jgi:hypothetical protein
MLDTRRLLLVALAVPTLAVAACGSSKGSSDKDKLTSIIQKGGSDPASICDHLDAATLKTIGGKAGCLTASKGQKPDTTVKVTSLTVSGDKATAKITDKKGPQTVKFVKVGGDWKVSSSG